MTTTFFKTTDSCHHYHDCYCCYCCRYCHCLVVLLLLMMMMMLILLLLLVLLLRPAMATTTGTIVGHISVFWSFVVSVLLLHYCFTERQAGSRPRQPTVIHHVSPPPQPVTRRASPAETLKASDLNFHLCLQISPKTVQEFLQLSCKLGSPALNPTLILVPLRYKYRVMSLLGCPASRAGAPKSFSHD